MTTRSSSISTILIICLLLFTFPLWIGLPAGLFGLVVGVVGAAFGAVIGVMGAVVAAIVTVIALPFKLIFGWGHHGFSFFHMNGFLALAIIVLVFLLVRKRKQ